MRTHNPLALEAHFGDRIHALRSASMTAEELSSALGRLLAEIDVNISLAHIDCDEQALAAWSAAHDFVRKEIS